MKAQPPQPEPAMPPLSDTRTAAGALAKGFAALGNPSVLWVVVVSLVLTILGLVGLWKLTEWLLTGFEIFKWGWANWLVDTFTGVVIFFAVLLMFPAVLLIVTSMFLVYVVKAVEKQHYPHLPPARETTILQDLAYMLKFTVLIIVVNLLVLPLYLLLPGINFVISWTVNGYITGREYYDLVAMRRMVDADREAVRRRNGGKIFSAGFVMAILMTVPILNLLMPVVSAAYVTHVFHALWKPGDTAAVR
jgi:CysZ protein